LAGSKYRYPDQNSQAKDFFLHRLMFRNHHSKT
jgi:hypothetical protein